MDIHKARHVVSILMESPLYLSLSLEERYDLLESMVKSYPGLFSAGSLNAEGETVSYDSIWSGIS